MRDVGFVKLPRMIKHGLITVGRDGAHCDAGVGGHGLAVALAHGAGVEGSDLVVVQVGGDVGLGGPVVAEGQNVVAGDAQPVQALGIVVKIGAHGGHGQRVAADAAQGVGDVAGGAAKVAVQLGHHKGDVDHVRLVGQDVVAKTLGENHDGVVGNGAADKHRH